MVRGEEHGCVTSPNCEEQGERCSGGDVAVPRWGSTSAGGLCFRLEGASQQLQFRCFISSTFGTSFRWQEKRNSVLSFGEQSRGTDAFVALSKDGAAGPSAAAMPQAALLEVLLGRDSRYATYGAPSNIKVWADGPGRGGARVLEVSFTAQGPQLEVDRRVCAAFQALPAGGSGGGVVALLVAGSSKAKWPEAADDARAMAASFEASR